MFTAKVLIIEFIKDHDNQRLRVKVSILLQLRTHSAIAFEDLYKPFNKPTCFEPTQKALTDITVDASSLTDFILHVPSHHSNLQDI